MRKIIIKNDHPHLTDLDALEYVSRVVAKGLISNENTQYCYASLFGSMVYVYADKTKNGTHVFRVSK